jgi:hypothetical protein
MGAYGHDWNPDYRHAHLHVVGEEINPDPMMEEDYGNKRRTGPG